MGKEKRLFCCDQDFVLKGFSVPTPGLYTCIKTCKNIYKIRLQRYFFKLANNGQSDKAFLLTSKFCPKGVVCPCPGAIFAERSDLLLFTFSYMARTIWVKKTV